MSERRAGPGYSLRKVRDAAGRWLWRATVWSGRRGDGQVVEIDQRGRRAELERLAGEQMERFNQQRGAAA